MPRDYKRRRPRKPPTPPWAWFSTGLAIGLSVALVVHLQHSRPGPEPVPVATRAAQPASQQAEENSGEQADVSSGGGFDFYTMLPGIEVVVPEDEARGRTARGGDAAALPPGRYWIQAGSFRRYPDADRRKAELALLGLGSSIQEVAIDGQTWHRVRIGPLPDAAQAEATRRRLADSGIAALALREREPD